MDAIASATSPNPNRIACGVVKFYKVGTELTYEPRNESFFISIKRLLSNANKMHCKIPKKIMFLII